MSRPHPETISPTAHYTGYVWLANGLSDPAFATPQGRLMYQTLRAPNRLAAFAGLPTLDGMLVARHRLIDHLLHDAITNHGITQVVEVATGLSPRGWRFRGAYGDRITYVECDLPGMLANKRAVLAALGGETSHHRTLEVDALADTGDHSIDAICASLDPARGTAIVTEGLINYFDMSTMRAIWRRFASALRRFPTGRYYSDLILAGHNQNAFTSAFSLVLSAFVRGRVHLHFDTEAEAEGALALDGFDAHLRNPADYARELPGLELRGARRIRIVDAIVHPA